VTWERVRGSKQEDVVTLNKFGNEISTSKSKILTHLLKGKIKFIPLKTIMIILNELEYFKSLVKLAKKCKNEEA